MIEASLEEGRRKGLGRTLDQHSLVAMRPMYLALVGALTDTLSFVLGLDPEDQSTPIAVSEGRPENDPHADRGGRQVTDVDVGSHRPLAWLKRWHGELVGGELEVAHQHRGHQHLDAGVAEPVGRHRLVDDDREGVGRPGFQPHASPPMAGGAGGVDA
jgi:hypothetical protein